jgi:hypothetical protein
MNFFDHKDLGNHLPQLCPKVVKHPVYVSVYKKKTKKSKIIFRNSYLKKGLPNDSSKGTTYVSDVRQIDVHTVESLVPGLSHLKVETAIAKLKKYKLPGSEQILEELVQAGGEILVSAIHKLINSLWNKVKLPDQWKEYIIVPVHKKGDKIGCNNYRGISLISTSYKMPSNILLPRLSRYIDKIIGDHQCGFRRNRSTDQIFCICQILEKKWEYNETVHQLFIDLKKAYDSVRREVLYNILIEFGVSMKLVRLIKM